MPVYNGRSVVRSDFYVCSLCHDHRQVDAGEFYVVTRTRKSENDITAIYCASCYEQIK